MLKNKEKGETHSTDKLPFYFSRPVRLFLGVFYALSTIIAVIFCIPIYLYRLFVIFVTKVARPDLGEILNAQSNIQAQELFTKCPPRGNIVICMTVVSNVTEEEVRTSLHKNCLFAVDKRNGTLMYRNLQQYPVQWMGYTFYKHAFDTFSLDNHVFFHREVGIERPATEKEIINLTEKLLNSPYKPEISPWEIHIVHNYVNPRISPEPEMSIVLFKVHHSLADGFSLLKTIMEGICGYSLKTLTMPVARFPKRNFWEALKFNLTRPLCGFYQLAVGGSEVIRPSPWKVPDHKKQWHQYLAKTDLIPIQKIYHIKNRFDVTFTSVLLSAISSALYQTKEIIKSQRKLLAPDDGSVFCMCPFPVPNHDGALTNHATANLFDIPTIGFENPVERLRKCHSAFKASRDSVILNLTRCMSILGGSLVNPLAHFICRNKVFSSSLTNFPGLPEQMEFCGRKCITTDFIVGSIRGVSGIGTRVLRYGDYIRVCAVAEKALLSREEVANFTQFIYDEINVLYDECRVHA